jgi:hypothetical protein
LSEVKVKNQYFQFQIMLYTTCWLSQMENVFGLI